MLREALTLVLLTAATPAEPQPLPAGVQAVEVAQGTAYLLVKGSAESRLTLLPEGVYFTRAGYLTLESATLGFQDNVAALTKRVADYEQAALTPCPQQAITAPGWRTETVVILVLASLLVGGVVGYKVAK